MDQNEIHKVIIPTNVIIKKGDKFLMIRRSENKKFAPGYLFPIGGKVERQEDPYIGAIREVKEETGLDIANLRLECINFEKNPYKDRTEDWMTFYFSAEYTGGTIAPQEDEGQLLWLTREAILNDKLHSSLKHVIEDIFDYNKGTVFTTMTYEREDKAKLIHKNLCQSG